MTIIVPFTHTCGQWLHLVFTRLTIAPAHGDLRDSGAKGQIVEDRHPPSEQTLSRMYDLDGGEFTQIPVYADEDPIVCPNCHLPISPDEFFPPRPRTVRFFDDEASFDDDVYDADTDDIPPF